jgi:hypothetical protein
MELESLRGRIPRQSPSLAEMQDPNREMRTMVLLALPYPPLPVLATRFESDDGRLLEDAVTTSHTFIARGLDEAMARNDQGENCARKIRQQECFREMLHTMATDGFTCPPERLYLIYCRHTLQHIATYFPVGYPLDVRFQPFGYSTRGDASHAKLAEYMAGQSIFFEDAPPVTREQYLRLEPHELLAALRDRLGHAMTDEERERAGCAAPPD